MGHNAVVHLLMPWGHSTVTPICMILLWLLVFSISTISIHASHIEYKVQCNVQSIIISINVNQCVNNVSMYNNLINHVLYLYHMIRAYNMSIVIYGFIYINKANYKS